ncbi:MAG TPA: epimerase, partial [Gammaproteobacteria bacterium]|nr:epimerase [Gammaproteobacteria bacterium]
GLMRAATSRASVGETYFLAGPEIVSWLELGRLIGAAVGVAGRVLHIPEGVASGAGRLADALALVRRRAAIFSSQKVLEMRAPAWVCSAAKAERDLGWRAATPLDDALASTAGWYRENGWL